MKNEVSPENNSIAPKFEKALWAAGLNMARHNAWRTLCHIAQATDKSKAPVIKEEQLNDALANLLLSPKKSAVQVKLAMQLLNKHFPFLQQMLLFHVSNKEENRETDATVQVQPNPQDYFDVLKTMFGLLHELRNSTTHVIAAGYQLAFAQFRYLETTFDASIRKTKERFWNDDPKTGDKMMQHLWRFDQRGKIKANFFYNFRNGNQLTGKGLAYFVCLFLEKKYAILLLQQLPGFKDSREQWKQMTLECYTVYRIVLPRERLDSATTDITLGMDMLNELQRCPGRLYEHLSDEDRQRFRIRAKDAALQDDDLQENEDDQILMKRYGDRFPYFAMRYMDQKKLLWKIRFHIDMGNYYFDNYPKTLYDGEEEKRYLSKRLLAFGRIQDMEEKFNELRTDNKTLFFPDNGDTKEFRMPTYPHYHINSPLNSVIGIRFDDAVPEVKGRETKTESPQAWLSLYELPAMLFLACLERDNKRMNKAEQTLMTYKTNINNLFKKIRDNDSAINTFRDELASGDKTEDDFKALFAISWHQLPKVFQEYLSKKAVSYDREKEKYAKAKLQWLIEDTHERLEKLSKLEEDIKANKIKPGKRRHPQIKTGVLAAFLAEDMMMLQPSKADGKDKMTAPNYNSLQAHLALWGTEESRAALPQIFIRSGLTGRASNNRHPFLEAVGDVTQYRTLGSFYKAYLLQRKKYFEDCLLKQKWGVHVVSNNKLQEKHKHADKYYQDLAGKMIQDGGNPEALPLNIPRGIFMDALKEIFENDPVLKPALDAPKISAVYLIQQYMQLKCNDEAQAFYAFPRHYKFWDQLFFQGYKKPLAACPKVFMATHSDERLKLLKDKVKLQVEKNKADKTIGNPDYVQQAFTGFDKNEKKLRLAKAQDMLLFLTASHLLFENSNITLQGKLKTIMPNTEDSFLNQTQPVALEFATKGGLKKTITQAQLKIKNFGDFKHLVRDNRLATFFNWYAPGTITREELEKELEQYDRLRVRVFEKVHEFETAMYHKEKEKLDGMAAKNEEAGNGYYVEFKKILWHYLKDYGKIETPDVDNNIVNITRNVFAHNHYPENKDAFPAYNPALHTEGVATFIYNEFVRVMDGYISTINDSQTTGMA